jgi:putative transposase
MSAFRFIAAERAHHPISVMCRMLDVSPSGFHAWQRRAPSDRQLSDAWLTERIAQIHHANRGVYGAARVHAELRLAHGIRVGRKRVERLMRQAGLSGVVPKRRGAPRSASRASASPTTLSGASFARRPPTCCGWLTSRICAPGRDGYISLPSRTRSRAGSLAGAWPITCAQTLSSTR